MIIYSVTVNIEPDIESEWLRWMKTKHLPDVMATGCFLEYRMSKILNNQSGDEGINYNIQYLCKPSEYEKYQNDYAPKLQQEHAEKFTNKFMAFRTILEVVQ